MLGNTHTIGEIAGILSAELIGHHALHTQVIRRIATDSRYEGIDKDCLFVALKTNRNDGHLYIPEAAAKGVRCFLVDDSHSIQPKEGQLFLRVSSSLKALQLLAKHDRQLLNYPLIGITGSNGKTIVKEWLFHVFSGKKDIEKSPKSYNSQIGVPLSLLQFRPKAFLGLVEAGISQPNEMAGLEEMIKPDVGLITNIHSAHLENFKDKSKLASEKWQLFKTCKKIYCCTDYEVLKPFIQEALVAGKEVHQWSSKDKSADTKVDWKRIENGSQINLLNNKRSFEFRIPFYDDASVENAVHVALIALDYGMREAELKERLASLPAVAMRLEQLSGLNQCTIINDTYNSDLTSLEIALQFMKMQVQHEDRTLILSDLQHTGQSDESLYKKVGELCEIYGVNRLIGIGPRITSTAALFPGKSWFYKSTSEFLDHIGHHSFYNEAILIKGARKFGFERIARTLENQKHETVLEVNLSAILDNLNFFRSKLQPGTKMMVMVKAFSYGTGSYEIANVLQHHGVDYLSVAFIDEGITLRNNGITMPLMVLNPSLGNMADLAEHNLEPEIYNLEALRIAANFTKHTGKNLRIHLKLDTGMHRLGFEEDDVAEMIRLLKESPQLEIASVLSHLAGSDNAELDPYTKKQAKRFVQMTERVKREAGSVGLRHLVNSDGILRFPDLHFDMVRLGIGLHGISTVTEFRSSLRQVIRIKTRISQLKELRKGDSIGYNRNHIAKRDMLTATIPIGYADGMVRALGNGNWLCKVGNQLVPVIGNICMDMCFLDVTDVQDVHEKDEVIVLGASNDIYKMAESRNTIPYEILTAFPERIKRIYQYGD